MKMLAQSWFWFCWNHSVPQNVSCGRWATRTVLLTAWSQFRPSKTATACVSWSRSCSRILWQDPHERLPHPSSCFPHQYILSTQQDIERLRAFWHGVSAFRATSQLEIDHHPAVRRSCLHGRLARRRMTERSQVLLLFVPSMLDLIILIGIRSGTSFRNIAIENCVCIALSAQRFFLCIDQWEGAINFSLPSC